MMSGQFGANTGTSTPNLGGVAGQGGELLKGFSAFVGNKVTCSQFHVVMSHLFHSFPIA